MHLWLPSNYANILSSDQSATFSEPVELSLVEFGALITPLVTIVKLATRSKMTRKVYTINGTFKL